MQEIIEYIKQAFDLKSQKCYKQAIEMLYKALEIESDNIEILFQLGELYFLLNNFQRSMQYLEKVLENNPNHVEALKLIQKIYKYTNEKENASKIAEKIYEIQKNQDNLINLIDALSASCNLTKISELEALNTDNDDVIYHIAKAFYDNGKIQEAKEKLEKILEINSKNENALVLLGKIYFEENEFDKSKNIFNTFSKNSENPEVLNYLGLFALEDMKFIDAIKYFSKAASLDRINHRYQYNLGNAYFYNGWFKEAVQSYLQAIRMAPENSGYRYSLAYLYYEQKEFEKAQKEIDYILEHNPEYSLAHVLNALLKFENKDFLGAQAELETNLKVSGEDNFTLTALSKVYKELSMFEKAEKVIANTPQSLNYKCQLADIYIKEKKYDKALEIVSEILKENENYISAYEIGAKAAYQKQDYEEAKRYAQEAISLDMNFASGYYYLALVRFTEKDYEEAIECMKRAIMYDVNNAQYYAEMSNIYKEIQDYKTALEYIKEAESISPSLEYQIMYKELASLNRKSK